MRDTGTIDTGIVCVHPPRVPPPQAIRTFNESPGLPSIGVTRSTAIFAVASLAAISPEQMTRTVTTECTNRRDAPHWAI
jgi:hypothetical protein